MLTIKFVRPDKSEWIEEVSSVALNTPAQSLTGRRSISYFTVDKEYHCVDVFEGEVYVMNSSGKTIANYFLDIMPKETKLSEVDNRHVAVPEN